MSTQTTAAPPTAATSGRGKDRPAFASAYSLAASLTVGLTPGFETEAESLRASASNSPAVR